MLLLKKLRWPLALVVIAVLAYYGLKPYWLTQLTQQENARIVALKQQALPAEPLQRLDAERMMADLRWLAAAERQGRAPGTPGGIAARLWIAEQFAAIGLTPAGTEGYLHPYSVTEHFSLRRWFRGKNAVIPGVADAANVLGLLPGTESGLKPLIITAHYDHLGMHGDTIFFGADDNASGVAAMLELARYLKQQPLRHPVLFVALDSEEKGLQGAVALFRTGLFDVGAHHVLDLRDEQVHRDGVLRLRHVVEARVIHQRRRVAHCLEPFLVANLFSRICRTRLHVVLKAEGVSDFVRDDELHQTPHQRIGVLQVV